MQFKKNSYACNDFHVEYNYLHLSYYLKDYAKPKLVSSLKRLYNHFSDLEKRYAVTE